MYKVAMTSLATLRQRPAGTATIAFTEAERNQVLAHLDAIFSSAVFRNSKRYCTLLRYVVERSLDGQAEQLKERTIGVEAFGRPADYDTTVDHSVRSAAGEVRRRLAQFYMESGAESDVRIDILPGSYVPQIRFADRPSVSEELERPAPLVLPEAPPSPRVRPARPRPIVRRAFERVVAACAIVTLLVFGLAFRLAWHSQTAFEQLWNPVLASSKEALLCFGGGQPLAGEALPTNLRQFDASPARRMNVSDALTLVAVTGTLRTLGKPYRILSRANTTSFKDLQQGPFILIGAMNNEWSLRLTSGLRYTFEHLPEGGNRIVDKKNPGNTAWYFSYSTLIDQPVRDYALVTRLRDPMTEQTALIVAGIGSWGTQAAGEFVSNPDHVRKLEASAPPHWEQKNLQVVIATDIIQGSPGPPIVLASYFW